MRDPWGRAYWLRAGFVNGDPGRSVRRGNTVPSAAHAADRAAAASRAAETQSAVRVGSSGESSHLFLLLLFPPALEPAGIATQLDDLAQGVRNRRIFTRDITGMVDEEPVAEI